MSILNLDAWRLTFSAIRVQSQVPQIFVSGWKVLSNNPCYQTILVIIFLSKLNEMLAEKRDAGC